MYQKRTLFLATVATVAEFLSEFSNACGSSTSAVHEGNDGSETVKGGFFNR
jgi:hypothetical protein